jgi:hypothetical protein
MRRLLIPVALAGWVGIALGCASASARDLSDYRNERGYRDGWYRAYERHRVARERRQARWEERAHDRRRAYERYLINREYYSYSRYSRRYRHYSYNYNRDRDYYGPYYYRPYYDRHDYYGPRVYSYYSEYSDYPDYSKYTAERPREWRPEDFPTGWKAWWGRMDRDGRGGRQ